MFEPLVPPDGTKFKRAAALGPATGLSSIKSLLLGPKKEQSEEREQIDLPLRFHNVQVRSAEGHLVPPMTVVSRINFFNLNLCSYPRVADLIRCKSQQGEAVIFITELSGKESHAILREAGVRDRTYNLMHNSIFSLSDNGKRTAFRMALEIFAQPDPRKKRLPVRADIDGVVWVFDGHKGLLLQQAVMTMLDFPGEFFCRGVLVTGTKEECAVWKKRITAGSDVYDPERAKVFQTLPTLIGDAGSAMEEFLR